nr:carboxylesterase [Oceanococcus sp. HetDA_MAG_MS8]
MKATQVGDDRIVVEPEIAANAAVIWMHGLGADGNDFVPLVPELELSSGIALRFIFPHAPVRPVTLNGGMPMRAWFDILQLGSFEKQDEEGIVASQERIFALIDEQLSAGIDSRRIILAGFSQGGAMALHAGLRYPKPLAGILGLSTFLPVHNKLAEQAHSANAATPIQLCHGDFDPVLPRMLGEWSRDMLRQQGYQVAWNSYPMAHQVCAPEITQISEFFNSLLS